MIEMMKVLLVTIQVLLCLSVLIQSNSVSLAEEQHSFIQARARHDILLAEGNGIKEQNVQRTKKDNEENEESSPSITSASFPPLLSDSEPSDVQKYGREHFVTYFSNSSEQSKRSLDSLSPLLARSSLTSSTSQNQKAIRDALTSGSASLADFSSFLASRAPSSSTAFSQPNGLAFTPEDQPMQEKDSETQKIDSDDGLTASAMTSDDVRNVGSSRGEEQVMSEEEPNSAHLSSSSQEQEVGGDRRQTQQMVPYQSPRPPNVRAPQVFSSHLQRHWANKHAWFATRRPLPRPFFTRPRTSPPSPFAPAPPTHGKYISSAPRTQKYMRPVDYVRNRFYPKRRNMFPSQFQRRPSSFFSSLLHPHSSSHSSTSALMSNHPNQMHTPNSPLFMMYPMNLRNWFLSNPLFSGTRRPAPSMNPSILAFPFPTITNRLPPPKFNAVNNQDPRKSNKRGRKNMTFNRGGGGIKTAASTTSSTYTVGRQFGSIRSPGTGQRRRSFQFDRNDKQVKSRNRKRHNSNKGSKVSRFVSDTRLGTNDAVRDEIPQSTISLNTWKGINKERLRGEIRNSKESKREKVLTRVTRGVVKEERTERKSNRKHFGSYELSESEDVKNSPIIVPVSSYISFIASHSNKSAEPHPPSFPASTPSPIQMRRPDVTLTAEPTFQLFGGGHALNKHDIHHHYYYNDRSDTDSDDEDGYSRHKGKHDEEQKKDEREKAVAKEEVEEELEKRRKQKAKEKKFMDEKGKKRKVEEKKEKEVKTKDEGQKDDNYKSKEEGKLGVYWFKDSGHKKHGWKNVYHKEEWGDSKKFHDIFHDKDWKKKWNKWDSSKEKSKGSKYKSDKKRYTSKKLDDEKKVEKEGRKKWKHEHGSGYKKKEHLDTHQEHESHEKKSKAHKLKGKLSKNNRSMRQKQPKVSESHSHKYPSASNLQEHHRDYVSARERDHHRHHSDQDPSGAEKSDGESPSADSIDFRQSSLPVKHMRKGRKVPSNGGSQRKKLQESEDVTRRRVKHYPDERKSRLEIQKVRENDTKEEELEVANGINNSKNFNQKTKGRIKEIETNPDEEEERGGGEGEERGGGEGEGGNTEGSEDDVDGEEEETVNDQEVSTEDGKQYEEYEGTNRKKEGNKNSVLSGDEVSSGKNPPKKPAFYISSNIRSSRPNAAHNVSNQRTRINANLRNYKSESGQRKIFSTPYPGKQPFKQLLVTPPSPSSTIPIMYPSIPIPASTTIYGPTVPIIEHQPNTFQAQPLSSTHFVPANNLIYRRPGLAFLSVLKSLTSVPVLLPTSTSGAGTSLISSASAPPLSKLLYHPVGTAASSPSPTHISSFSYHLEQLQQQKASMGRSSR